MTEEPIPETSMDESNKFWEKSSAVATSQPCDAGKRVYTASTTTKDGVQCNAVFIVSSGSECMDAPGTSEMPIQELLQTETERGNSVEREVRDVQGAILEKGVHKPSASSQSSAKSGYHLPSLSETPEHSEVSQSVPSANGKAMIDHEGPKMHMVAELGTIASPEQSASCTADTECKASDTGCDAACDDVANSNATSLETDSKTEIPSAPPVEKQSPCENQISSATAKPKRSNSGSEAAQPASACNQQSSNFAAITKRELKSATPGNVTRSVITSREPNSKTDVSEQTPTKKFNVSVKPGKSNGGSEMRIQKSSVDARKDQRTSSSTQKQFAPTVVTKTSMRVKQSNPPVTHKEATNVKAFGNIQRRVVNSSAKVADASMKATPANTKVSAFDDHDKVKKSLNQHRSVVTTTPSANTSPTFPKKAKIHSSKKSAASTCIARNITTDKLRTLRSQLCKLKNSMTALRETCILTH